MVETAGCGGKVSKAAEVLMEKHDRDGAPLRLKIRRHFFVSCSLLIPSSCSSAALVDLSGSSPTCGVAVGGLFQSPDGFRGSFSEVLSRWSVVKCWINDARENKVRRKKVRAVSESEDLFVAPNGGRPRKLNDILRNLELDEREKAAEDRRRRAARKIISTGKIDFYKAPDGFHGTWDSVLDHQIVLEEWIDEFQMKSAFE